MPDWFPLISAARYLGVPPWELAKQSVFWRNVALEHESAIAEIKQRRLDREKSK